MKLPSREIGHLGEFFGFEPKPAFRIYDAQGEEVAYQRVAQRMEKPLRAQQRLRQMSVTIAVEVRIPATGYTTLTVKEAPKETTRHTMSPGLATSERSMENEICMFRLRMMAPSVVDNAMDRLI